MRMIARSMAVLILSAFIHAGPVAAQAERSASEASVPDQPWYPPDYHELRLVAAATIESVARDREALLGLDEDDGETEIYSVDDCSLGEDLPDGMDYDSVQVAALALDMARIRAEMRALGYRSDVYDQPLIDYERAALADIEARRIERLEDPEEYPVYEQFRHDAYANPELVDELASELDARRRRLQPDKWRITGVAGCGSGYGPFTIELVPGNGRLWLINAFAFRVCERKVRDPWNKTACSWSEYQAGDDTMATGRYIYEVRWPGSAVQRGARILQPDMSDYENGDVVVFRRN